MDTDGDGNAGGADRDKRDAEHPVKLFQWNAME